VNDDSNEDILNSEEILRDEQNSNLNIRNLYGAQKQNKKFRSYILI
jgi:hypothetical protein